MSRIVFTLGLALLFAAAGLLASRASHRADFSARNQEAKVPLDQTFGAGSTTPGTGRAPAVPPLDQQQPAKIETATFALGWFWGPDSQFGGIDGVIRTRVGYTGGTKKDPTYYQLGDHTESIEVDFDPAQVSYEELVRQFFAMHNPLSRPYSVQYRSAIFVHDAQQRATAEQVLKELEAQSSRMIYTAIEDAGEFYLAEDYHQKYYLKHDRIFAQELHRLFGDDEAKLIHSSVAARLSGLVGGYAPKSLTADSVDQLGLSDKGRQHALDLLSGSARPQIMCR